MKILFVACEIYPFKSATSNCVLSIINELNKYGIICDIINISGSTSLPEKLEWEKIQIYNFFDFQLTDNSQFSKGRLKKPIVFLQKGLIKIINLLQGMPFNPITIKRLTEKILTIDNEYDILIPVCSRVNSAELCFQYCCKRKKDYILYQVDPIGTNFAYNNKKSMEKLEYKYYQKARAILTTHILAKEKRENDSYKQFLYKIIPIEFPNVKVSNNEKWTCNNSQSFECFYAGRFYSGVRDCKYTLELFSMINDQRIKLTFAGSGQEDIIQEYQKNQLLGRLNHLGELPLAKTISYMERVDFLINIGNNVINQVPSKLFDYISTGKPIINICKNSECPTIPYIERYGLGLNIIETEKTNFYWAEVLRDFIIFNHNKRLDNDRIILAFEENTPEYVGKVFYNTLLNYFDK